MPAETREPEHIGGGPLSADQAVPTLLMVLVAMLGGFVAFYRKWKDGEVRAFNFTELIGELVTSGICGLIAYWAFKGMGVSDWLAGAGVGIVGHMGSRAIFLAEKLLEKWADRWMNR